MTEFPKTSSRQDKAASSSSNLILIIFIIIGIGLTCFCLNDVYAISDETTSYSYDEDTSTSASSSRRTTTEEYTTSTKRSTTTTTSKYYEDDDYDNDYDDDYVEDYITKYDYPEIDENNSLRSSSTSSSRTSSSSKASSSRDTSSSGESLLPKNSSKNSDINSQNWDQLLSNLSSNSNKTSQFTFSNTDNSNSKSNSSWILWLGIIFIILSVCGIFWVIYTELISKKSPRKLRAAASAKIAAKRAAAKRELHAALNNKNQITNQTNEYGDIYSANTSKRRPPQPPNIPIPRRGVSISGSAGKPKPKSTKSVAEKVAPDSKNAPSKNNVSNTAQRQNNANNKSRVRHKHNSSFWDNFFGK